MRKMKRFGFCYPMDTKVFDTPGTTTPDPWLPNVAESVLPMVEDEFKVKFRILLENFSDLSDF